MRTIPESSSACAILIEIIWFIEMAISLSVDATKLYDAESRVEVIWMPGHMGGM